MPQLPPSTPPGQGAWLSAALKNTEYSRNFMHYEKAEPGRVVPLPSIVELNRRMKKGDAITEGEIPRQQFYMNAWKFEETLPPVILMSFLALRRDVADIFRRFDLGRGRLHPVDLLEFDRVTLVSLDYEILTPGNAIETLDLPRSTGIMRRGWGEKGAHNLFPPRALRAAGGGSGTKGCPTTSPGQEERTSRSMSCNPASRRSPMSGSTRG